MRWIASAYAYKHIHNPNLLQMCEFSAAELNSTDLNRAKYNMYTETYQKHTGLKLIEYGFVHCAVGFI